MKDKAFPLLNLMVMKRNGKINSIGCANGSYHRFHMGKHELTSLAPDFFSVKHARGVETKE